MTEKPSDNSEKPGNRQGLSRRQALARLGVGASVAYSAPMLLPLNENAAHAVGEPPGGGPPSPKGKGGPPWGRPTRPTRPSKPDHGGHKDRDRDHGDGHDWDRDGGRDRDRDRNRDRDGRGDADRTGQDGGDHGGARDSGDRGGRRNGRGGNNDRSG